MGLATDALGASAVNVVRARSRNSVITGPGTVLGPQYLLWDGRQIALRGPTVWPPSVVGHSVFSECYRV